MKKLMMFLLLTAICLGSVSGVLQTQASADVQTQAAADYYKEIEVRVELRGSGTFSMEEQANPSNKQTIVSTGQAFFVQRYSEPGNYKYVIYSEQSNMGKRYIVDISIYQSILKEDELAAVVSITNASDNNKVTPPYADYMPIPAPTPTQTPGQNQNQNPGGPGSENYGKGEDSVKTGDNNDLVYYSMSLAVLAVCAGVLLSGRRAKKD